MTPEEIAAAAAVAPPAVDAAALQAKIDELTEQVAEGQRTAEFWAAKARNGAPATGAPAADAEDDTDVLEAITTGGAKGFDALAKKRGFIQRDEVEELINTKAASLTKEQDLIARFPDLKVKTSDFFKATAAHYGDLVKAKVPQAVAMEQAANMAELEFLRSGKIKLPAAEGTGQTKAQKEEARLARIAAQAPEGGRRPAPTADEDDTELDAAQLNIVRKMLVGQPGADGKPMNEEQAIERYKARASTGVSIKGGGR